jgi:predicted RNA-binding Zn-ribbon protein involved in translation (DUF1610 family)
MTRRVLFLACAAAMIARCVHAANKTYRYRCPKCKLIQEYGTPGTRKCPNDGRVMILEN